MSSDEKGLITIITNMAATERRKTKRKSALKDELEKPTKEEYAVAKHLRFNAPSKEGKFLGNSVQYFIGSKIIDAMLDSKWATKNQKTPALFTTRSTCANYCQRLLEKGFFHRVAKLTKKDKERSTTSAGKRKEEIVQSKRKEKKNKKDAQLALESKPEKEGEEKKTTDTTTTSKQIVEKSETTKEKEESTEDKKRKKKKLKLELHDKQDFLDGPELYVWIYDPVPIKTFIIGLFLVFGAIAVCLFPLWPPEVKIGIYYLSLAAAGFIGLILALCIVRMVVFVIVWLITIGKVSFWLLPNLTEDVGFFESFLPVWKYELKDAAKKDEKPDPDSAKNVDPIGPANEEASRENDDDKAKDKNGEDQEKAADVDDDDEDEGRVEEEEERVDEEEDSEEEEDEENKIDDDDEDGGRRHSSSNENGYEIIDKEDVQL